MLHMPVALLHLNGFVPGSLIARSSVPVLSKSHSMCTIHYLHRLYCNFVCRPRWPRVFRKAGPATALPYQHPPERPAGVGYRKRFLLPFIEWEHTPARPRYTTHR